jgi:exosortase H (IPTLxxWG-CTERM-specific)
MRAKRPVLGFVLVFAVLMAAYYAATFIDVIETRAIPAYMRFNAQASGALLNLLGENADVNGSSITSARFSVDIQHGCDAIDPSALFIAAVLAFPAPLRSKLPGVLIGTLVLAAINLIRIVSLFYTGIYFPKAFQTVHVDVWQPVFILLALTFWVAWAWWATRTRPGPSDVSVETA